MLTFCKFFWLFAQKTLDVILAVQKECYCAKMVYYSLKLAYVLLCIVRTHKYIHCGYLNISVHMYEIFEIKLMEYYYIKVKYVAYVVAMENVLLLQKKIKNIFFFKVFFFFYCFCKFVFTWKCFLIFYFSLR